MKKRVWALLDNRMGSVGQIRGITGIMNPEAYEIVEKQLVYNRWANLPNLLKGCSLLGLTKQSKTSISKDFPELVISASRRTATAALWIKKQSPQTKVIQLLHPDVSTANLKLFDRIFLPEHDRYKQSAGNCFYTTGSPHRVSAKALEEAQGKWQKSFEALPKPLTAVIAGGSIKGKPFALENAKELGRQIRLLKERTGGSVLITDSKRTGNEAEKIIMAELDGIPVHSYLWGSKDENPIMGYWACADNIVVTEDSVSMTCESCGAGKPVFIFCGENWLTPKHYRFVESLYAGGYAVPLAENCEKFTEGKVLFPATEIVAEIDKLFE